MQSQPQTGDKKILDEVRDVMRLHHYSPSTPSGRIATGSDALQDWVKSQFSIIHLGVGYKERSIYDSL